MNQQDRDRCLALAGVFQAARIAQQFAHEGKADQQAWQHSTQSIFETLEQFALDLEGGTPIGNVINDLSLAMEHLSGFRTQTGGRLNSIESHEVLNEDIIFEGQKTLSSIEDLDFAEAVSRLNLQLATLQAAQQSFAKIQNLSLFNYL